MRLSFQTKTTTPDLGDSNDHCNIFFILFIFYILYFIYFLYILYFIYFLFFDSSTDLYFYDETKRVRYVFNNNNKEIINYLLYFEKSRVRAGLGAGVEKEEREEEAEGVLAVVAVAVATVCRTDFSNAWGESKRVKGREGRGGRGEEQREGEDQDNT